MDDYAGNGKYSLMKVDVNKIEYSPEMSKAAIDFIQSLLRKHLHEQLRADKLLTHPFLNRPEVNRPAKQP
jgi:serine/threonine protein kinase